jgi:Protein of unknown function (DUF559)
MSGRESLQHRRPGIAGKDLMPGLGGLLWQHQQLPSQLLVSGKQYYWLLPCRKHVRFMSVQAAARQVAEDHDGNLQLHDCERCGCSYKTVGPEPAACDVHRSYYEQCCWLYLEQMLDRPDVRHVMHASATSDCNMMVGPDTGYVVEARVVTGWRGAVDVYVPALRLVVQIDGQHHQSTEQQDTDIKFIQVAHQQRFNVLRLWHADLYTMPQDLLCMVHSCMHHPAGTGMAPATVKCTRSHPLCTHQVYKTITEISTV